MKNTSVITRRRCWLVVVVLLVLQCSTYVHLVDSFNIMQRSYPFTTYSSIHSFECNTSRNIVALNTPKNIIYMKQAIIRQQSSSNDDNENDTLSNNDASTTQSIVAATSTTTATPAVNADGVVIVCPDCDLCDGSGRILGGLGAIFTWIPIKAYRPCPNYIANGGVYERSGQPLDEIAFGRDSTFKK